MGNFLRNLRLDQISFWLGFLAGSLLWFLLAGLRPFFAKLRARMRVRAQTSRGEAVQVNEVRLGNETLQMAQGWHLAAPLFSLNEILVPPRLLAPPVPPETEDKQQFQDITDWAIPYLPDWPELGSFYGAPTMDLAETLAGNANIAVIGQPGTGKTIALAHLATQLIQDRIQIGEGISYFPLLLHVCDLVLPPTNPEDPTNTLLEAIARFASPRTMKRVPKLLNSLIEQQRALLLLDGLDELSPEQIDQAVQYLKALFEQHPNLRAVVSANPAYLDGLLSLGFAPIPIASWDQVQRESFIRKWGELWGQFVQPPTAEEAESNRLLLLNGWLLNDTALLTPLELTLKVWAAFAGDSLSSSPWDAIEAYLRRMMHNHPAKNRPASEHLALQMTLALRPLADRREAEAWLSGSTTLPHSDSESQEQGEARRSTKKDLVKAPGALTDLLASGLVISHASERVRFSHPVLTGYLAGQALSQNQSVGQLINQPNWTGRALALHRAALLDEQSPFIESMLVEEDADPLLRDTLTAARWLRRSPDQMAWTSVMMRKLATLLQKENLSFSVKARAVAALALSGKPGIGVLLRQMLAAPREDLRQLAALGCGILRDAKSTNELGKLLSDKSAKVMHAAMLALVAIGDKIALEAVAYALLHGNENLRRAAAEGLANNLEEGHPTLEEGSTLEDPLVRRAVVYGLMRIQQPWAIETLEKLRTQDSQWVVQDAATQVLAALQRPNPHIPRQLPPLTQTPWLIAFAAERGMGVAPGKPAYDLLYRAIKEGSNEQRLAAIHYLSLRGDESSVLPLYQIYYSETGELREASYSALWHLAATGIELPQPAQYGLK